MLTSTGYARFIANDDSKGTANGWDATLGGVVSKAALASNGYTLVPVGQLGGARSRYRGLNAIFFGTDQANETGSARLWWLKHIRNPSGKLQNDDTLIMHLFGSVAITLGAETGIADGQIVDDNYLFADTLVWTLATTSTSPKGIGGVIEAAVESPGAAVYSPANDGVAELAIPDLGNPDFILWEFNRGGSAARLNALNDLTT